MGVRLSKGTRAAAVLVSFGVSIGLILFAIFGFLRSEPPTVSATPAPSEPNTVNVTMQIDGAVGVGPHPTWVGYWIQDAQGVYHQTTLLQVPEKTMVHVTAYEYDSGGALRNALWSKVTGVANSSVNLDGKVVSVLDPAAGNGIAHTFVVPGLGVTVPFYGVDGNAKNFCNAGPCNLSEAHTTTTFSFYSGDKVASYHWQCFVPCGLGYLNGNGGPMTSLGYMAGFIKVVS